MGLMVGRIGIGAIFDGAFDQVERLAGCGRVLVVMISFVEDACTGAGRGVIFSFPDVG
jgi:hypothetical protein